MNDPAREIQGLRILVGVLALILLVQWARSGPPAPAPVPAFELVAQQGRILSIFVAEPVATDDAALYRIADSLTPILLGHTIVLQVWTDRRLVPEHGALEMTDAELAARRALVSINPSTGLRNISRDKD